MRGIGEGFKEYRNLREQGYSKEEAVLKSRDRIPLMILSTKADDYLGKTSKIDDVLYGKYQKNNGKSRPLQNANGDYIIEVKKTELYGEPNSITQFVGDKGGIDRNYYGDDGHQIKQISNNGHGHPKEETIGKHGEHAHDYEFNENGELEHQPARELTYWERKENEDIL